MSGPIRRWMAIVPVLLILPALTRAQNAPEPPPVDAAPFLESDTPRFDEPGREGEDDKDDDEKKSQILTRLLGLDGKGVEFNGDWIGDENMALFGGRHPGKQAFGNLLNFAVNVDLEKTCGLKGGQLFGLFQNHSGINGHALAGDDQFFDNIDAIPVPGRTQLSELWYRQTFCDEKVRLKIGKIDANEDFAYVANANDFIHNAFGNSPTIFVLPSYPDPATGMNLFFYPSKKTYLGIGMYDGSVARGVTTGLLGPATFFKPPHNYFWIAETGLNYQLGKDKLPGRLGVGYWYNNAQFVKFENTFRPREQPEYQHGTGGPYLVLDQTLWKEKPDDDKDDQAVRFFYQFGYGDPNVNLFHLSHGIGVMRSGPLRGRDDDSAGFGIAFAAFSDKDLAFNQRRERFRPTPHSANEIAYQWFYKCRCNANLAIQPVLTYIYDPGEDKRLASPLMVTMRVLLDF